MNDYWHIPRASLASSSSASSASSTHRSSKTKPPTLEQNSSLGPMKQRKDRQLLDGNTTTMKMAYRGNGQTRVGIANHANNARRDSELSGKRAATTASATAVVLAAASVSTTSMEKVASSTKRGSRSSQGSSGSSNNSTRSAASGSLLLTAANLERFAAIHKKQQQMPTQHNKLCMELVPTIGGNSNTNGINWTKALQKQHLRHPQQHPQQNSKHNTCADNEATIIMMDPNLDFIKTKDLDTVSIASSMHFTMVNGEGGPPKKPKRGLCDRGRQVTVLIVSMSTIFLLLILGMVYALEMRAREMPQS